MGYGWINEYTLNKKKVEELRKFALKIDSSLDFFADLHVKVSEQTPLSEASLLYRIVNYYGIFSDRDPFIIKTTQSLFTVFFRYSFVDKDQNNRCKDLYRIMSALRAWLAHNINVDSEEGNDNIKQILRYLKKIIIVKPDAEAIDEKLNQDISLSSRDLIDKQISKNWDLIDQDLRNREDYFFETFESALKNWEKSEDKQNAVKSWYQMFSDELYSHENLRRSVLYEIMLFQKKCCGKHGKNDVLIKELWDELSKKKFSSETIRKCLEADCITDKGAFNIMKESMQSLLSN